MGLLVNCMFREIENNSVVAPVIHSSEIKSQIIDTIADSILVSYAVEINQYLSNIHKDIGQDFVEILIGKTDRKCLSNSKRAALFIFDKYPDLFKKAFILHADFSDAPDIKKSRPFKKGNWTDHAGLVLEDIQGEWHFISPANHRLEPPSPLLTHYRAGSLETILEQIEGNESAVAFQAFPSQEEIISEIIKSGSPTKLKPTKGNCSVFVFKLHHGPDGFRRTEHDFLRFIRR